METTLPFVVKKQVKRFVKRLISPKPAVRANKPRKDQLFSIGIYAGESPLALRSLENGANPVLTSSDVSDGPALFVADPFMLRANGTWYMFFEVVNLQSKKGEIGLATSDDGVKWAYRQIVLKEPFHLSYPYVFEWRGDYYMIPESYKAKSIRLYRASDFPTEWSLVGTLLDEVSFVDSSIFRINSKWWLLAGDGKPPFRADVLRLYCADDLLGPWSEHPASPIIQGNPHIARPAGRVLLFDGRIIRFAQDCHPEYGTQVRAFEITELTSRIYHERAVPENPILAPSGSGWNGSGMHHIDPHLRDDGLWIACVDGFRWPESKS